MKAHNLRDFIKAQFTTQTEFAKAQGVAKSQITQWLNDDYKVIEENGVFSLFSKRREIEMADTLEKQAIEQITQKSQQYTASIIESMQKQKEAVLYNLNIKELGTKQEQLNAFIQHLEDTKECCIDRFDEIQGEALRDFSRCDDIEDLPFYDLSCDERTQQEDDFLEAINEIITDIEDLKED